MMRTIPSLLTTLAAVACIHTAVAQDYPAARLSNENLTVQIYLPDTEKGYYRGTRFEWSGLVDKVIYKGHEFFGDWKTGSHDPQNHDDVNGLASEFSMGMNDLEPPLNFDEAGAGESFLKIGIGLLKKPDNRTYSPFRKYEIVDAYDWDVTHEEDWIRFIQEPETFNGWKYRFIKEITLQPDGFTVHHTLENNGTKAIHSSHYCHNFTKIDGDVIGANYIVSFPFNVTARRDMNNLAETKGKEIVFKQDVKDNAFFTELDGWEKTADHNQITITNLRMESAVTVKGDFTPARFNFYAANLAACPEPFIKIDLEPGEKLTWKNVYTFNTLNPISPVKRGIVNQVIPGGIAAAGIPLGDVIALLQQNFKIRFVLGSGVSDRLVVIDRQGNPTLGEILDTMLPAIDCEYDVNDSGVVMITKIEG